MFSLRSEGRTSGGGGGAATEGKRPSAGGGGGGAAATAAGNRRRPAQRRNVAGNASLVEGAIGRKQKDGVEELKDRLKRECTAGVVLLCDMFPAQPVSARGGAANAVCFDDVGGVRDEW